jgi:hypothetical protein
MDPTHFSTVRHYYQQTAECLLDDKTKATYPEINKKDLQAFRDTYGASAYVCRFLHCVFSTDGFVSSSQRVKHESQHQRRFHYAHSSCVYFARGFVSRNLLNKHNENYHPTIAKGPSLAESLAPYSYGHGQISGAPSLPPSLPQPTRTDIDAFLALFPSIPESEVILRLKVTVNLHRRSTMFTANVPREITTKSTKL